ncbi:alginate lyase-domain-containing protein [Mucidula mucida]|nr:alginate lyase-domain-containing protein [Mucidula mucida]
MSRFIPALTLFSTFIASTSADGTDWINVKYFSGTLDASYQSASRNAARAIIRGADAANKHGPYAIVNSEGVLPPSRDCHDYLSWAPYHWPDCNWCGGGRKYISPNSNDTNDDSEGDSPDSATSPDGSDYETGDSSFDDDAAAWHEDYAEQGVADIAQRHHTLNTRLRHRMVRQKRQFVSSVSVPQDSLPEPTTSVDSSLPITTEPIAPSQVTHMPLDSSTTQPVAGTHAPAQAAVKSSKKKDTSSCTPSPTTSMAPSATWTTCPYVIRDGKVNPDVRTLRGPGAINKFTQQAIYNVMAYILTKSDSYAETFVKAVDVFYLNSETHMNPNMNYGQVSRGPGPTGRQGTFTGVLDGRGHVKAVNAIQLLKALKHRSWTKDHDRKILQWMSDYNDWATKSDIGKKSQSRPNNHGTFFAAQMASTRMLVNDLVGARKIITDFFEHAFQDQIAASGEQPFEAVRTRPFHYRCFNLEALITCAKIAEELGLDAWSIKTKHGSTIRSSRFHNEGRSKEEKISELVPHVVSISRAYGDPAGTYSAWLKKAMGDYQDKPFWLYNQTPPPSKVSRRMPIMRRDDLEGPDLSFKCPAIFDNTPKVELEEGLFVTCEDLRPFFENKQELNSSV